MKIVSTNITRLAKAPLLIGIALLLAVVAVFASGQTASAASCRYYNTWTPGANVAPSSGDPGTWYYAFHTAYAPSGSACGSINIVRSSIETLQGGNNACGNFRIRFFPTSGGSWVTNYQLVCTGTGSAKLATSVINGTKYRVEADMRLRFTVFD